MHLFYCDESNLDKRSGDFLVYGGIAIPPEAASDLSASIEKIRKEGGISRDFQLKFNPRPAGMDHATFRDIKQAILETSVEHGTHLLAYAILHDIASSPDEARRFGINTVCYHFDCLLHRIGGHGVVLIDRFNDEGNKIDAHLVEKFTVGLTGMPHSREYRMERVLGFHYSAIGQSNFTSLIDIALGSLRYSMNVHTRRITEQRQSAKNVLRILSPLFYREKDSDAVSEISIELSPKVIKSDKYKYIYRSMKDFLAEGNIKIAQKIAD